MEINGEWQLGGLNSLQSESVRGREVTAAPVSSWEKSYTAGEQRQKMSVSLKPRAVVIKHLSHPGVLALSQYDGDTEGTAGEIWGTEVHSRGALKEGGGASQK